MIMLDNFMGQLTKDLEISESLGTEVPGVYAFPIDEEVSVLISTLPRGFELTCTLIDSPASQEEEFYTQALHANLYGEGTDLAVLGLDAEGKKITLSKYVDYPVNYQEFREILEDFLNSVDFWMAEVGAWSQA